jgi:hypothetical protein
MLTFLRGHPLLTRSSLAMIDLIIESCSQIIFFQAFNAKWHSSFFSKPLISFEISIDSIVEAILPPVYNISTFYIPKNICSHAYFTEERYLYMFWQLRISILKLFSPGIFFELGPSTLGRLLVADISLITAYTASGYIKTIIMGDLSKSR